jgi:two-component system KDP operon response regulator KdpE
MDESHLILVVDDDPSILHLVRLELAEHGFRVLTAESGTKGLRLAQEALPDLVVLDLLLPDMLGTEVMRELHQQSSVPVILLTAKSADADKVRGFQQGADDYVAKPFSPEELVARINAVLRRAKVIPGEGESIVRLLAGLQVDLARRLVLRDGEIVPLTRTEWNLLQCLAENVGKVMLGSDLLSRVWGPEYRDDIHYLRVWISRLRSKLEPDRPEPSLIRTFPGVGYMLRGPGLEDDTEGFLPG